MTDLLEIGLPKWPALVVKGKKITKEEAAEILIRTDDFWFSANDHDFERQLFEACGIKVRSKYEMSEEDKEAFSTLKKDISHIELEYLSNHRIVSSWIGGPHGWCNWEGNIGCNNYNIGKHPSCKEVYNEWIKIAGAFPFLTLKSLLFSGESSEEGIEPLIQFNISNGKVTYGSPDSDNFDEPSSLGEADLLNRFSNPYAERGCSIETFKAAIEMVKGKFSIINKSW